MSGPGAGLIKPLGLVLAISAVGMIATTAFHKDAQASDPLAEGRAEAMAQIQHDNAIQADANAKKAKFIAQRGVEQKYIEDELTRLKKEQPGFTYDVMQEDSGSDVVIRTDIPAGGQFTDGSKPGHDVYVTKCVSIKMTMADVDEDGKMPKNLVDVKANSDMFGYQRTEGSHASVAFIAKEAALAFGLKTPSANFPKVQGKYTCAGVPMSATYG
jgi:hypothetical protein